MLRQCEHAAESRRGERRPPRGRQFTTSNSPDGNWTAVSEKGNLFLDAKEGGERKARWKTGDRPAEKPAARSTGYKSFGGGADKPARAGGFKSHASEGKTFGKPGAKAKPAPARFDAKDTSKRFVPPKKK